MHFLLIKQRYCWVLRYCRYSTSLEDTDIPHTLLGAMLFPQLCISACVMIALYHHYFDWSFSIFTMISCSLEEDHGCLTVDRSTTHLMKMVSSITKPLFLRSRWDTNRGQPLAIFISDFGFLNELLIGSGWKVSTMSRPPAWLISLKVTLWDKGHGRMSSNSPRIITKKSDMKQCST